MFDFQGLVRQAAEKISSIKTAIQIASGGIMMGTSLAFPAFEVEGRTMFYLALILFWSSTFVFNTLHWPNSLKSLPYALIMTCIPLMLVLPLNQKTLEDIKSRIPLLATWLSLLSVGMPTPQWRGITLTNVIRAAGSAIQVESEPHQLSYIRGAGSIRSGPASNTSSDIILSETGKVDPRGKWESDIRQFFTARVASASSSGRTSPDMYGRQVHTGSPRPP